MTLQTRFNAFYQSLDADSVAALPDIYDQHVTFSDPVGVHEGLNALTHYFKKLLIGCSYCDFTLRDQRFEADRGWVYWTMRFSNPRLNRGRMIVVHGASVLTIVEDKIVAQQDFYDMGCMVYEQIPLLGSLIRHIRGRMAA